MYKVYLEKEEKHLSKDGESVDLRKGKDHPVTFRTEEEARKAWEDYYKEHKPLRSKDHEKALIYKDTLHPELREGIERYYKGKIELAIDTPSGNAIVLRDDQIKRYGVAFLNMDTQDVFSKGGFQKKRHAVELAQETRDRDIAFTPRRLQINKPDFNMKKIETKEKVTHIEMEINR
jgi:hypothetical protein